MRVERKPGTWEALSVPALLEDLTDASHGIRLVSPTNGETQTQGRPELNDVIISSGRQMTGRRTQPKEGQPTTIGSQISP